MPLPFGHRAARAFPRVEPLNYISTAVCLRINNKTNDKKLRELRLLKKNKRRLIIIVVKITIFYTTHSRSWPTFIMFYR